MKARDRRGFSLNVSIEFRLRANDRFHPTLNRQPERRETDGDRPIPSSEIQRPEHPIPSFTVDGDVNR